MDGEGAGRGSVVVPCAGGLAIGAGWVAGIAWRDGDLAPAVAATVASLVMVATAAHLVGRGGAARGAPARFRLLYIELVAVTATLVALVAPCGVVGLGAYHLGLRGAELWAAVGIGVVSAVAGVGASVRWAGVGAVHLNIRGDGIAIRLGRWRGFVPAAEIDGVVARRRQVELRLRNGRVVPLGFGVRRGDVAALVALVVATCGLKPAAGR